ncbi:MAG: hypothetical protein ACYTGO_20565 [Planctomycetota bacterium]|jgi:hypothetical protein
MQTTAPLSAALVSLLLLGTTSAQTPTSYFVPDNNATQGACNVIPFGHTSTSDVSWSRQLYQQLITPAELNNRVGLICDLGFAPCVTGIRKFKTMEIKIDYFQGTGTTMSATFASNISSKAVTVLSATDHAWHVTANQWNRSGLQTPFLYLATRGPRVVQIKVTGAGSVNTSTAFPGFHNSRSRQRVFASGGQWSGGKPPATGRAASGAQKIEIVYTGADLGKFGESCKGSNGLLPSLDLTGSAVLGKSLTLSLTKALPSALAYLTVGLQQRPTPFDLGLAGAPGCRLYISNEVILVVKANTNGAYSSTFNVPSSSSLVCTRFFVQMLPFDQQANAFGATATNYGRILLGN